MSSVYDQAVERLDAIDSNDPERAHDDADEILLELVPADVVKAYRRLQGRCRWWATS